MCGIVGYIGSKKAGPILVDGLKRLEYRGYDSAGIATINESELSIKKKEGRIANLEHELSLDYPKGSTGIAHTRWATHGKPSDENAHPHQGQSDKIAIVHNGIIENYSDLKEDLIKQDHTFNSETDTEVLAHLIENQLEKTNGDLFEAVRSALIKVQGTYGIAVVSEDHPGEIIAAKNGSPLIIGIGENEHFIASDVAALLPYTKQVVYPNDGEILRVTKDGFEARVIETKKTTDSKVENVEWDSEAASKKGFEHFMLKEIFEQPNVIKNTVAGRLIESEGLAHLGGLNHTEEELRNVKRIVFCAMGSALLAGHIGKYIIEDLTGIPVDIENASELRYKRILIEKQSLIFTISQSGETADTLAAMREIQRKGHKVLGISNVVGSTIARENDGGIFIHAGPEIGVASTKALIAQVTSIVLLGLLLGRLRNLTAEEGVEIIDALNKIPHQIETILQKNDEIKAVAQKYASYSNFLFLGRKYNYPVALEGALKLKEISYIHAEGYPAGEMKHGPIALIDENFPSLFIAPQDSVYEKTISNIEEIKARNGKTLAIGSEGDHQLKKLVDDMLEVPKTIEVLQPLLTLIPLQLLAYHIAVINKKDVDKPRNLAKSVTVE